MDHSRLLNNIIEKGIMFLVIFPPLVFGAVDPWASAVMQIIAASIFGAWLLAHRRFEPLKLQAMTVLIFFGSGALFMTFQVIPLPPDLLKIISPKTSDIYREFLGDAQGGWHPISIAPGVTITELLRILSYGMVFTVVIHHFRTRNRIERLVRTIIVVTSLLVLVAVLQKVTWNGRIYWFYPIDPSLQDRLPYIWGPYVNRNHFAGLLELVVPLLLGLIVYETSRAGGRRTTSTKNVIARLLASRRLQRLGALILTVAFMMAALFATLSRGGILACFASLVVFGALIRRRRSLKRATKVLAVAGFCIMLLAVVATWERFFERFEDVGVSDNIMRPIVWRDALGLLADHPVFGTGFGTFSLAFPRYQRHYAATEFEHAENDYLELATDTGIVGVIIVVGLISLSVRTVFRKWMERKNSFSISLAAGGMSSVAAMAVHSLVDFNLRVPANAMLFSIIAGTTYAVVFHVSGHRQVGMVR